MSSKAPERPGRPAGRVLRAHVWLAATLIPLADRIFSLKRLLGLLTPPRFCRPYRGVAADEIARVVARRLRNPRHMRSRPCLRHGLTLFHFLRLAGLPAVLRIGVLPGAPDGGRMQAHCWVTLEGQCLLPPPEGAAAELIAHGGQDGVGEG